jgi:hypothetical protein
VSQIQLLLRILLIRHRPQRLFPES